AGDNGGAAEAALLLASISWHEGQSRDEMLAHLDQARTLVEGTPPSRARVSVLSDAARYEMLADRNDKAIELGGEALRMAEQLGLDDLRAHALNNVGTARAMAGDPHGFAELEESIALAGKINSIPDLIRGHNNLAAARVGHAQLKQAQTCWQETRRLAQHF